MITKILSCSILLVSGVLSAQSNLQFNQVKLVSAEETVPDGKVWKLESAMPSEARDFLPHSILVDGEPVYLSSFNTGDTYWSRIASIELDIRKTASTPCGNSATFQFQLTGFENDFPFSANRSASRTKDAVGTVFENLITYTPQTPGAVIELTSVYLYISAQAWRPFELRLTVNYIDGFSQSYTYASATSEFCGTGSATYYIGSSASPFQVPYRSKETYYMPAKFPMWLPEGTTLEAGYNVRAVSVIEFDVE